MKAAKLVGSLGLGLTACSHTQHRKVSTRSRMNPAWDGSEFYYRHPDGKRVRLSSRDDSQRRLWGLEKTSDSEGDREAFFVGKQEQFLLKVETASPK
jgi:hypothetical protein